MRRETLLPLLVAFLLVVCARDTPPPPGGAYPEISLLLCGVPARAACLERIRRGERIRPLVIALTNRAVFQFADTFAKCEGCNVEALPLEYGIGRCIAYSINELARRWEVNLWVSERCNFRYGAPSQSRISILVSKKTLAIERITPPEPYIRDPLFCEEDGDCRCLSGSGVPFLGCSNTLYAPLYFAGDYPCDRCSCRQGRCTDGK